MSKQMTFWQGKVIIITTVVCMLGFFVLAALGWAANTLTWVEDSFEDFNDGQFDACGTEEDSWLGRRSRPLVRQLGRSTPHRPFRCEGAGRSSVWQKPSFARVRQKRASAECKRGWKRWRPAVPGDS